MPILRRTGCNPPCGVYVTLRRPLLMDRWFLMPKDLMMVKYLNYNLDPALIRLKFEGTRKYLP